MLKKAGIVVAAATAGLLAVTPLAFAGDWSDSDRGSDPGTSYWGTSEIFTLDNSSADCALVNTQEANASQTGENFVLAFLGAATSTVTQTFTPATTQTGTITPSASCNNFVDEDNSEDNDSFVRGSFND